MKSGILSAVALIAGANGGMNAYDFDKTSRFGSLSSNSAQSAPKYNQRKVCRDARRVNRKVKR